MSTSDDVLRICNDSPVEQEHVDMVLRTQECADVAMQDEVRLPRSLDHLSHFRIAIVDQVPDAEHTGPDEEHDYLALFDRILLDRDISAHEADDLVKLADQLELSRTRCERVNLSYFQAVASVAWADGILTDTATADLMLLAQLLRIPEGEVHASLQQPSTEGSDEPVTTDQFKLLIGDLVVLTGDMKRPREVWAAELESAGLVWINYVTKKVRLLAAADPDTLSGKAAKARDYGIRLVNEDGLARLIAEL
jgi:DNA polymerase-3 subunit epsilon